VVQNVSAEAVQCLKSKVGIGPRLSSFSHNSTADVWFR